jgi:energy-converting hydrogenase A subunit R
MQASQTNKRVFVTDCEGPISKNDNAFELTKSFIPEGDSFFALLSKYDDVLSDIIRIPNYKAGDTLRLILPFLKAYGATDKQIRDFSSKNILLVPGAKSTINFVRKFMSSFIVSTSYEHYIFVLCKLIEFPFMKTYCTRLNIDKYQISPKETNRIKEIRNEIAALPMIKIPKNASSITKFSLQDQRTITRLNKIFWKKIPKMESGNMLTEINPVGGIEKAAAVKDIVRKIGSSFDQMMYVGDSITDAPALKLVRENGGLAISFNGNSYSVRESDVAVISDNTIVTSILAKAFSRLGKEETVNLVNEWDFCKLEKHFHDLELSENMHTHFSGSFPKVEQVTTENMDRLITESRLFRKTVRGEAIGKLG